MFPGLLPVTLPVSQQSSVPPVPPSIPIRSFRIIQDNPFGRLPPPIPPRLNEIKLQSLVGDTAPAAAAAPAATEPAAEAGGNDLGFLDVQVPSAQEVAAEQSQANKMANIMGAFGGAQAAAQPPMVSKFSTSGLNFRFKGGMGSPTSFGMATNNIGMQNPGMVNQTVNAGMAGINNMQAAGMQSPGMNQGGFGNMQAPMASPMGGAAQMSPMSTMAPPMSSTQAAPSANSNNTANAMYVNLYFRSNFSKF